VEKAGAVDSGRLPQPPQQACGSSHMSSSLAPGTDVWVESFPPVKFVIEMQSFKDVQVVS